MGTNYSASLKGQFLVAMPGLMDPNFYQTVTCLSEHTEAGAVGIVVNRIHPELHTHSIFEELRIHCTPRAGRLPVYLGGPVHLGEIFIIHGHPFTWTSCMMITPFLAMSNSLDILEAIAKECGPKSFIIALGCAGWGNGQLESEIKQNSWLTCPIDEGILFEIPLAHRWDEAVKKMGINPSLLSNKPGHA